MPSFSLFSPKDCRMTTQNVRNCKCKKDENDNEKCHFNSNKKLNCPVPDLNLRTLSPEMP